VPGGCKVVEDEPGRLRFDRCSNTSALQLSQKFRRISERAGTDTRHRRLWGEAAGRFLEEDYVGLVRTTPNGSNEPPTRPKNAGDLARCDGAINHIHRTERGQQGIKSAG